MYIKRKLLYIVKLTLLILIIATLFACSKQKIIKTSGLIAPVTKTQLFLRSDLIITGKITNISQGKWSNPGYIKDGARNIIQTDITIAINKIYKGEPYNNEKVLIRIDKGTVGDVTLESSGVPEFTKNENVLLFLSFDDSELRTEEKYYVVTGMFQGKFNLKSNNDSSVYINGVGEELNIFTLKYDIDKCILDNDNITSPNNDKSEP